jgi:hypothetical protein
MFHYRNLIDLDGAGLGGSCGIGLICPTHHSKSYVQGQRPLTPRARAFTLPRMEIHFTPDTEAQLKKFAASKARTPRRWWRRLSARCSNGRSALLKALSVALRPPTRATS